MVDEQKKTAHKNLQTFIVIELNVAFKNMFTSVLYGIHIF